MPTVVFPYSSSLAFSVSHSLRRELLENPFIGGHRRFGGGESSSLRANGSGGVESYKGINVFKVNFKRTMVGDEKLADLLWKFFLARLDNGNEAFYFYNPTERALPDLSGVASTGRYLVKLEDPNAGLNRDYFKACLFNYGFSFVECRGFSPDILGSASISPSASLSAGPASTLLDGLWAYWKMDEASSNRLDSSGNLRSLTPAGSGSELPTTDTGIVSGAVKFLRTVESTGPYLTRAESQNLSGDGKCTFAFWVKTYNASSLSLTDVFHLYSNFHIEIYSAYNYWGNAGLAILVEQLNTPWTFYLTTDPNSYAFTPDVWHLMVLYYDGVGLYLYVDNVLVVSQEGTHGLTSASGLTSLGYPNFNDYYSSVDEFGIWSRALTVDERTELWNSGVGITYPFE
jgi:hypothetical protein